MKRWLAGLVLGVAGVVGARAAEDAFSRAIPPAEFSAAGLDKLSAAELARLDALVRDFKHGRTEPATRPPVTAAATSTGAVPGVVTGGEGKRVGPAKVTVAPGTQVEFSTVGSRVAGQFLGWERGTVLTLENGQRWQVASSESYASPAIASPAVTVVPGILGSFWMSIEGVRPRVKVVPISGGK